MAWGWYCKEKIETSYSRGQRLRRWTGVDRKLSGSRLWCTDQEQWVLYIMTKSQIFPAVHNATKTIAFYHRTTVSLFPFQTKIDQHPISSCIITNELHCKVSRIKKRKHIKNRMENMHTEVTVYRVKLTCDFN